MTLIVKMIALLGCGTPRKYVRNMRVLRDCGEWASNLATEALNVAGQTGACDIVATLAGQHCGHITIRAEKDFRVQYTNKPLQRRFFVLSNPHAEGSVPLSGENQGSVSERAKAIQQVAGALSGIHGRAAHLANSGDQ